MEYTRKKSRTSSAASISASTSADADAFESLQDVMSRNTDTLRHMLQTEEAPVDFDDPHSVRRAQHKSFCEYVTNCVLSYDENEFDHFQSSFILLNERFKTARRQRQYRLSSQPTISQPMTSPVPFNLYDSSQRSSQQYQPDPSAWVESPPPSTVWGSQSQEYNAKYRQHQQDQLRQSAARSPRAPRPTNRPGELPPDPPLPVIKRMPTSTPKRPKANAKATKSTVSPSLDFSEFAIDSSGRGEEDLEQ